MTMARALVDVSVTRWHHCVTRCVRRALLLGEAAWGRLQKEAPLQKDTQRKVDTARGFR